jgi:1-deoxy-D-xylulose-5-phosphate synthase
MRAGTGLSKFAGRHPNRFFDVGMAEEHAVTFAAGLAVQGLRPVVAIYSTFLQRSYDQIVHDVCLQNLPVVFCLDRAGLVGRDGPTHHGVFDLSYLRHIPGLVVAAPRDGPELERMLTMALRHDGPVAIRYPAGAAGGPTSVGQREAPASPAEAGAPSADPLRGPAGGPTEVGRGVVLREGRDLAIVTIGTCADAALRAAVTLSERGIDAAVIDARFVKPLDADLICEWTERTGALITVEENVLQGGFGSAVLEMVSERGPGTAAVLVKRLGIADEFVCHGSRAELNAACGLDGAAIIAEAHELVAQRCPAR